MAELSHNGTGRCQADELLAKPGLRRFAAAAGSTSLPPRHRRRFLQGQKAVAAADAKEQLQGRG